MAILLEPRNISVGAYLNRMQEVLINDWNLGVYNNVVEGSNDEWTACISRNMLIYKRVM